MNVENSDVVEVKIKKKELNLIVWLVPLIAAIIGGWMIYKYYSKLGPKIYITFKNSGGLEPKQSFIKFRDVKVGVIEKVEILKGSDGVMVVARMNKDVEPFLNETTRFWLVKPEISIGKIRGLDALVSGTYIQMYAKLGKERRRFFKGLEEPPTSLFEKNGKTFKLISQKSYGLSQGSPVYYKQIKVGRIEKVLERDGRVLVYIFVKEPYYRKINGSTRFWNIQNVDISIEQMGLNIELNPLAQVILGGVEFDSVEPGEANLSTFVLYPTYKEAFRKRLGVGMESYMDFVFKFKNGVEGLDFKSVVKFKGFKIGEVKSINSKIDKEGKELNTSVVASLDISAFKRNLDEDGFKNLLELVKRGLKAQIRQNLLGVASIELTFSGKGGRLIKEKNRYIFPTVGVMRSEIIKSLEEILKKIKNLPLEKALNSFSSTFDKSKATIVELKKSLKNINVLLENNATKEIPKNLAQTLIEAQQTLKSYKELAKSYSEDSMFKEKVDKVLKDVDSAINETKKFIKKIERKPNRLIFGD